MTDHKQMVKNILEQSEKLPLCFLHSFGCQQNVSDGEKILGLLCEMGYGVTNDITAADLIIYNTAFAAHEVYVPEMKDGILDL